jgi:hypothetical protein
MPPIMSAAGNTDVALEGERPCEPMFHRRGGRRNRVKGLSMQSSQ